MKRLKRWSVVREDAPGLIIFSPRFYTRAAAERCAVSRNASFGTENWIAVKVP